MLTKVERQSGEVLTVHVPKGSDPGAGSHAFAVNPGDHGPLPPRRPLPPCRGDSSGIGPGLVPEMLGARRCRRDGKSRRSMIRRAGPPGPCVERLPSRPGPTPVSLFGRTAGSVQRATAPSVPATARQGPLLGQTSIAAYRRVRPWSFARRQSFSWAAPDRRGEVLPGRLGRDNAIGALPPYAVNRSWPIDFRSSTTPCGGSAMISRRKIHSSRRPRWPGRAGGIYRIFSDTPTSGQAMFKARSRQRRRAFCAVDP
jgi:hypothetical protein